MNFSLLVGHLIKDKFAIDEQQNLSRSIPGVAVQGEIGLLSLHLLEFRRMRDLVKI